MRQLMQHVRAHIQYTVILPYLLLMVVVMLIGSGVAITLVAGSWQERFNNQLGQVARNFAETFAQREISNIEYLGQITFTAPNAETNAPSVPQALAARDASGLESAMRGLWTLGLSDASVSQDRLIVFDTAGQALLDWERSLDTPNAPIRYIGTDLSQQPLVQAVLNGETTVLPGGEVAGDKYSGLIAFRASDGTDNLYFFTVIPVRLGAADESSEIIGGLLVAQRLDRLLQYLQSQSQSAVSTIFDVDGEIMATTVPSAETSTIEIDSATINQLIDLNQSVSGTAGGTIDPCLDIGNLAGRLVTPLETTQLPVCSLSDEEFVSGRSYQVVYAPLLIRGVQSGYFAVGLSRDFVINAWSSSRNVVFLVTGGLALGGVLLGVWVARRITRPLDDLVDTAQAVTTGDLDRRSTVRDANELGTLATAFNQMTEHLLRLYTASRELNRTIEIEEALTIASDAARSFVPGVEVLALLKADDAYSYVLHPDIDERMHSLQSLMVAGDSSLLAALRSYDSSSSNLLRLAPLTIAESGLRDTGMESAAVMPVVQSAQIVGALLIAHHEANVLDDVSLQRLAVIANMTVAVLANAVLYEQVQQDSKQRQAILTSIGDGVVVCDDQGRIVLVNRAAEKLLGLDSLTAYRRRLADLPIEVVGRNHDIFGQTGEQFRVGDRYLTLNRAPVVAEDGHTTGEVVVVHDITKAVNVDKAKNDFIATISHELRTPLTVIRGYIELLLRGTGGSKPNDDQVELLETVRARAIDITDLVNNAILIADIETGKLTTELAPQDLEAAITMALAPQRSAFEAKGLNVTLDIPADLPEVLADREHLKRVFSQLLDNARRYTERGGVTMRAEVDGPIVRVHVVDTGPGISSDILPLLFKRFQRIEGNNSQQRGGGLGLAITRQLIELQGGTVTVQSSPGQGSTFTITLVKAHEQSLAVAQPNESQSTTP